MSLISDGEKFDYNCIDIVKILMAVFVIAIHTSPLANIESGIFLNIYNIIISTAVPFFFMSSGFLVMNKMECNNDIGIIWKYVLKIIRLYLIWTIIYMPLTIYGYITNDNSLLNDILSFIRGMFFIGEHYNSWILWYLLSLIYSILLIGILLRCKVRIKGIYFISVLLFIFGHIMTIWGDKLDMLQYPVEKLVRYYRFVFLHGRLFTGMFYIMTGMIISKYKNNISIFLSIGLMLFVGNIFVNELYYSVSIAVYSIIIFYLTISIDIKNKKLYKKLRDASTVFYFTHMVFWSFYTILILKNPNHPGIDSFFVSLMCCVIASFILIKLKEHKRFKWLKNIIN